MTQTDQILISVVSQTTQVALLGNGILQEFHREQADKQGILGNIYQAKVRRVVAGMQAAFVDIGADKLGFLHLKDIPTQAPDIQSHLRDGQSVLVQVSREAIKQKGARLSMQLSLASKTLVYLPYSNTVALSHKIQNQRQQLKQLAEALLSESELTGALIVRSDAPWVEEAQIHRDWQQLTQQWRAIQDKLKPQANASKPIRLVYQTPPLLLRILHECDLSALPTISLDNPDAAQQLRALASEFYPQLTANIVEHTRPTPLFEAIETQLHQATLPTVDLPSGGTIVIEQTEAMTTIDVNTAAFIGKQNADTTVQITNQEAAVAIAQQLRLRNIGGIVVIDFIDMPTAHAQNHILKALQNACASDPSVVVSNRVSRLGLVELSRRCTGPNLAQLLTQP